VGVRRSPAARLLGQLAAQPGDPTHEALDVLPQGELTAYVRGLLVSAGILAARDENLALLTRWLARTLAKLPPAHVTLIRAFAEWHVLRDARRRSARGRYTYAAYKGDSGNIRAAARVLALPPIMIADLFGIAPGTTHRWAQLASNSWSDYLSALPDTAPAVRPS
jgi:hypothetical protein